MAAPEYSEYSQIPAHRVLTAQAKQLAQQQFLDNLAACGNVLHACGDNPLVQRNVYNWRLVDPAFAAQWDQVMAPHRQIRLARLEEAAHTRAVDGVEEVTPIYYQGDKVGEKRIRRYANDLLMFLLEAEDPARYRNNTVEHTGAVDLTLLTETERAQRAARLLDQAASRLVDGAVVRADDDPPAE